MKLYQLGNNKAEIETKLATVFFSYNTPVACVIDGRYYRTEKFWSVTTSRHIHEWLGNIDATKKPQTFFDNLIK